MPNSFLRPDSALFRIPMQGGRPNSINTDQNQLTGRAPFDATNISVFPGNEKTVCGTPNIDRVQLLRVTFPKGLKLESVRIGALEMLREQGDSDYELPIELPISVGARQFCVTFRNLTSRRIDGLVSFWGRKI